MRVGVAQINPTLGEFTRNKDKIVDFAKRAKDRHCRLVVFPEAALFGYHPFDLLERPEVIRAQNMALKALLKEVPPGLGVLVGAFTENKAKRGRPFYNSAVLLERGKILKSFHKVLLPTGDVFDEARFIEPGHVADNFFTYGGKKFFVTICEDIWAWADSNGRSIYRQNPIEEMKPRKVDLIFNISASPYYPGKFKLRRDLVKRTAARLKAPMIFCNLIGAQDEIIYDGASFALDSRGREVLRCLYFHEDFQVFDMETGAGELHPSLDCEAEELRQAIVLGIRDFCLKTGMERVHVGISGGIDSALVAALAVDALGPSKVKGLFLPTEFTSELSHSIVAKLKKNLGIEILEFPIHKTFQDLKNEVDGRLGIKEFSVTHENLQARLRGLILMAYANEFGSLLLATGNKPELACGYSTLYGDLCGGLLPIGDLTKGQIVELARHYNRETEIIPPKAIERPPSAELRPGQKDEDSLPPYKELDKTVQHIVERNGSIRGDQDRWLLKALVGSEFKRWQAPPILKVSSHSFGRGRRWPLAHKAFKG